VPVDFELAAHYNRLGAERQRYRHDQSGLMLPRRRGRRPLSCRRAQVVPPRHAPRRPASAILP
jgi:hypothetical protein